MHLYEATTSNLIAFPLLLSNSLCLPESHVLRTSFVVFILCSLHHYQSSMSGSWWWRRRRWPQRQLVVQLRCVSLARRTNFHRIILPSSNMHIAHLIFIVSSSGMASLLCFFLFWSVVDVAVAICGGHTIGTDLLFSSYGCTCITHISQYTLYAFFAIFTAVFTTCTYNVHLSHLRGACKCIPHRSAPQKWENKIKFKCETPTNVSKARNDWTKKATTAKRIMHSGI